MAEATCGSWESIYKASRDEELEKVSNRVRGVLECNASGRELSKVIWFCSEWWGQAV